MLQICFSILFEGKNVIETLKILSGVKVCEKNNPNTEKLANQFQSGKYPGRARKWEFYSAKAKQDILAHVWVDTCTGWIEAFPCRH